MRVEGCYGCGGCVAVCPTGAVEMQDGADIDLEKCSGCMLCVRVCPTALPSPIVGGRRG
ncbi:MAG: ferredoxin [Thermoproteota archaeon]|nr:MAG: ferredoxin [Candidatus Korarchaeota archaeon]